MTPEIPSSLTQAKDWLEISYYISQIIIMILIAVGLRQLQLAKKQIETTKNIFKTQSKRAAVEAAVVECRHFANTIIPDRIALDKYCKENEITLFEDIKFSLTDDGFSINTKDLKEEDLEKIASAHDIINRLINSMESYALFFLSGVADEKIAFHSNAKAFIEMAEHIFKLFPICNVEEDDAEPIKTLYFMWQEKYENKKLKIKKDEIEKKLSSYSAPNLKPIGT